MESEVDDKSSDKANRPKPPKPPVPPKPVGYRPPPHPTNDHGTRGVESQVSLENHVPSIVVSNAEENASTLPTDDNNNNGQAHTRLAESSSPGEPITNGETTPKTIAPSAIVLETTTDAVEPAKGKENRIPKAVMAREESLESVENQVCCSNLASFFVHKAKALAHPPQTKNKKVPPPKPPKPKKEDIERARKRLSSFGEEIPGGRDGFRYVDDDVSTESSVDYKDVIFENGRILAINRLPKPPKSDSPEPEPVVKECDYEPLDFYQQGMLKPKVDVSADNSESEFYFKKDALMNDLSCKGLSKHSSEITLSDHLNNNHVDFSEKLLNDQSSIGRRTVASENIFYDACETLQTEQCGDVIANNSVESRTTDVNRNYTEDSKNEHEQQKVLDAVLKDEHKTENESKPVNQIDANLNETEKQEISKENPGPHVSNVEDTEEVFIAKDENMSCTTKAAIVIPAGDDSQVDLTTQIRRSSQDDNSIPKESTIVTRRSPSEERHSWPIRGKKIPPERPPPPRRKCFSMSDSDSDKKTQLEKVKPPRPPPPTPPTSLRKPNKGKDDPKAPPRQNRSRSKTVELTPETLQSLQESDSSVRRSVSFTERDKQKPDIKAMYSTIDTSKKQSYDKMKFRPLPPPPAPPRTHSKRSDGTTSPTLTSDCSITDKAPVESQRPTDNTISQLSSDSKKGSSKVTKAKPARQSKPDLKIYTQDVLADENANLPPSSQNSFLSRQPDNIVTPRKKQDKIDSGGKTRQYATSTFYCDNLNTSGATSENRSKSPSPMVMRSRVSARQSLDGTESEVSGINADVDSSPNSSRQVSVERTFSKSKKGDRSSVFYYDIPPESKQCVEKSVQTSPDMSSCQVTDKGEDSDELMNIANDIRRELNSILQRRNNMESTDSDLPSSQDELQVQRIIRGGPGSSRSSEVSWQESSDESEIEVDISTLSAAAVTAQQSKSLSPEEKKFNKLKYIAHELMSSESTFVDALRLLNVEFCNAVKRSSTERGSAVVPDEVMNHIFRYLPQLQNLNENLLQEIKVRTDNWDKYQKISDVIVKIGPFLKLYSSYIREFESVTVMLDEACRKYPHFGQLVSDFEKSNVCQKLALKHYLLKPVQRIPQYRLLLEDYLHNLTPDSIDYEDTVKALQIVSEVANHANETMKQGDNFLKLVSIQNSLLTHHEIVKPGKVFLKEGELMKLSRRVMQSRWFILFNDSLLYLTPVQQGLYRVNHELPLTGMRVSVPMQTEYRNEFSVISVTRSFSLAAKSAEERDDWITDLTRAIEENAVKRSSFINTQKGKAPFVMPDTALGKQAPVWIPDSRVTMCQLCTTEFTITYRRHHCRACGRVVCNACSQNKASLPYLDNQYARVCDTCFEKLSEDCLRGSRTLSTSSTDHRTTDSELEVAGASTIGSRMSSVIKQGKKSLLPKVLQERSNREARYSPTPYYRVRANDQGSDISGHLFMLSRRAWKRFWFVVKDKVLYTYKASEDVAAKKSLPLLGFTVETTTNAIQGIDPQLIFLLTHPGQPNVVFHAESIGFAERWVKTIRNATVL